MLARDVLHGLDQFDPIHVRHVQVAQHQANLRVFSEALQGMAAGFARDAAIAAIFDKFTKLLDDQWLIVDHEHFYSRSELVHTLLHAWQAK